MAKINQQNLVITLSNLIKDSDTESTILSPDAVESLEAVIAELAGAGVIVEIQQA
jgi:hypothetical protein